MKREGKKRQRCTILDWKKGKLEGAWTFDAVKLHNLGFEIDAEIDQSAKILYEIIEAKI